MSGLAPALSDSLLRLLPPPPQADAALLQPVVTALCQALERGELGIDLEAPPPEGIAAEGWPELQLEALAAAGWLEEVIVRDGSWLRWRRWHGQLQQCLEQITSRSQQAHQPTPPAAGLQAVRRITEAAGLDAQQSAAVSALLQQRLVLLLGGPGTGKTSTVATMLRAALVLEPQLRVQLAAPTGKAAARLAEALAEALDPEQQRPCSTLHRLLEARGGGRFGRNARRPLELDLLVVDEVSMVDLPLMAALLAALPDEARLVLVGDPGQLPPVGTGAVLEELCRPDQRQRLGAAVVELSTTYRNNGAIAGIAAALRDTPPGAATSGNTVQALRPQLEQLSSHDNLHWLEAPVQLLPAAVLEALEEQQQRLAQLCRTLRWIGAEPHPEDSAALLSQLEQRIALSPVRQGPWGVEALHRALLGAAALAPLERWPLGTPVLNRRNRPEQELANGDTGVLVQRDGETWVLMGSGRLLHPARLAGAEPALALTVHKAQGSQYREVLLLAAPSRHSDARLLYTGLTRARERAVLVTPAGHP